MKATLPAPSAFHFFRLAEAVDPAAYPDVSGYFDDLVAVYRAEVAELAEAGCRYLQLDEVPVAMLCDEGVRRQAAAEGGEPRRCSTPISASIRRILADCPPRHDHRHAPVPRQLPQPLDGGGRLRAGGREALQRGAGRRLLPGVRQRARRRLPPLRFVPKGKRIVLGLVSSKTPELEGQEALLRRIEEAARFCPLDRLALSTQCGFASVAGGNALTEDQQWAELELVVATARRAWGQA